MSAPAARSRAPSAKQRSPEGQLKPAGALAGPHADHVPGPVGGLEAQVGPIARRRGLRPGHQRAHLLDETLGGRLTPLLRLRTLHLALVGRRGPPVAQLGLNPSRAHLGHALAADVVAAPLQHGVFQRDREPETRLHQRQVLLGQLILQRLRGRGDDHLLAAEGGGDQVRQRLARPRPGLDDEVGAGDQGLGDGAAHLLLLGPVLAARHLGRDLVEAGDPVVARLAGFLDRPAARRAEDVVLIELVEVLLHLLVLHRESTLQPGWRTPVSGW